MTESHSCQAVRLGVSVYVPTVSTPGVYSPPDSDPVDLDRVQNILREDPEVIQALDHLAFSLFNGTCKRRAFDAFEERFFFLFLRAESRAEQMQAEDETDEGWEHA